VTRRPVVRRAARRGYTLAELMIVIVILAIVMMGTSKSMLAVQKDYVTQRGAAQVQERLQSAEETIVRVLRAGRADPLGAGVGVIDPNPQGNPTRDNVRVRSDFNPADGDVSDPLEDVLVFVRNDSLLVRWEANQRATAVAYPVRSIAFSYYQLDGTPSTAAPLDSLARRVKVEIAVPKTVGSTELVRREAWVFLRN
jgi:prepilin-type N-terminal cleavage/methylation domain-containing protein